MPSSYVPPSGRPLPDGSINIDAATAFSPKLILVAYPTNDTANGYSVSETVTNLLTIRSYAQAKGVSVVVEGTQPRDLPDAQRALLPQIDEQLAAAIGPCFVNVRSLLASADGRINPIYDSGDGVHPNDAGHQVIFAQVKALLDAGACVLAN
jgi:lysophospholipase L1-like esterase